MISRNKGIFSSDFLVPALGLLAAILLVEPFYRMVVRPRAEEIELKQRVMAAQGATAGKNSEQRSVYVIINDPEQEIEIIFALWGVIILGHKLLQVKRERGLFRHDFIRIQPGERIIPEDALDRYRKCGPRWNVIPAGTANCCPSACSPRCIASMPPTPSRTRRTP
jgi:hypothetical protein